MRMASITQLEYVLAVDRVKHFGKAAKLCHVSQPSLSAQIQKVEEELGVIIFDRSKMPVMVTEAGKGLIEQAKVVLREHKKLSYVASLGSSVPKGDFHLAVIPTLAPHLIPLFIGPFSKAFPKVHLKVNEYKTEDMIRLLANDELDAGLLVTPLGDDRLIERHLFFERFHVYASQKHPFSKKTSISEKQLVTEDLWLLEEGHCFRSQILRICSLDRTGSVLSNVEFESGNLETLKNLVRKNNGYTLLPELAVNDLSPSEVKKYVRSFEKPAPTREVSIVYSRSFSKETIINALETAILGALPEHIRSLKKKDVHLIDI